MSVDGSWVEARTQWVQWRTRQLLSAGFPTDLAGRLARTDRIDLHRLLSLVDRGCPPHLAARILAPLDEDPETGVRPR
jgi:hypothetical protein